MKNKTSPAGIERFLAPFTFVTILILVLSVVVALTIQLGLGGYDDLEHFARYSHLISSGHTPYTGLQVEYPPGGVFIILAAGWLAYVFSSYESAFVLFSTAALASVLGHVLVRQGWKKLAVFVLALLPLLQFAFFELDIFAAALLYFSLWQLHKKRYFWSAILLAAATLIKAYPGVAILGLFWLIPKGKRKVYLASFVGSLAVVLVPLAVIIPRGLLYSFTYHTGRPIEIEASAAAVGFIGHALGWPAHVFMSHSSRAISFPHDNLVGSLSTLCLAVGLVAISWLAWRGRWKHRPVTLNIALLTVFILFFKVGSPQYLLAPLLLLPLARQELPLKLYRQLYSLMLVAGLVFWLQFVCCFHILNSFNHGHYAMSFAALSLARLAILGSLLIWLVKIGQSKKPL